MELRFCISSQLLGDAAAAGPTALHKQGSWQHRVSEERGSDQVSVTSLAQSTRGRRLSVLFIQGH